MTLSDNTPDDMTFLTDEACRQLFATHIDPLMPQHIRSAEDEGLPAEWLSAEAGDGAADLVSCETVPVAGDAFHVERGVAGESVPCETRSRSRWASASLLAMLGLTFCFVIAIAPRTSEQPATVEAPATQERSDSAAAFEAGAEPAPAVIAEQPLLPLVVPHSEPAPFEPFIPGPLGPTSPVRTRDLESDVDPALDPILQDLGIEIFNPDDPE